MKCRNKHYACHRDPAERHGPYLECIYKVHNQIVNLKPYPEAAPLYRAAIQPHRKVRSPLGRLERLSRIALAHRARQVQSQRRHENPGYSRILS
jgi:hypothetical protein